MKSRKDLAGPHCSEDAARPPVSPAPPEDESSVERRKILARLGKAGFAAPATLALLALEARAAPSG